MKDPLVLEEIRVAKDGVAEAEDDLASLMKDIEVAPRAAKTTINEALHAALQKLRHAREHLGKLETLLRAKAD